MNLTRDCTDCLKCITHRKISDYASLQEAIKEMERMSKDKYSVANSGKLQHDDPHFETLKYLRITFKCVKAASMQCYAKFHVRSLGGEFHVTSSVMIHNHAGEEDKTVVDDYKVETDLTNEFMEVFHQKSYESIAEVRKLLKDYENKTGSLFMCKRSTKKKRNGGGDGDIYRQFDVQCIHYGKKKSKRVVPLDAQKRSKKLGCKAEIKFTTEAAKVFAKNAYLKHNHRVMPLFGNAPIKW